MNKVIVLVTSGKYEGAQYAEVHTFPDETTAREFCAKTNTGVIKYWTKAEIVKEGEEIALGI